MNATLYSTEFPDFDYALPVIEGFRNVSWHNDACPSLMNDDETLTLWCDYADVTKREMQGGRLFTLVRCCEVGRMGDLIIATDSLAEALRVIWTIQSTT